jgi:transposase InsO family protein
MSQNNSTTPVTVPDLLANTPTATCAAEETMEGIETGNVSELSQAKTTESVMAMSEDHKEEKGPIGDLAINILMDRRTVASQRYANLLISDGAELLGNDPEAYDREMERLIKCIDTYNKHIDVMVTANRKIQIHKAVSEAMPTERAPATNNGDTTILMRLAPRDLPKFQLAGDTVYYPGETVYNSVEHFLRTFEKTLISTGNDVERTWKQYIQGTLAMDYDVWMKGDLLVQDTWETARKVFLDTFGGAQDKLDARRLVMNMRIRTNETINSFNLRFTRAASEAGYSKFDNTIADAFMYALPQAWQPAINTVLHSNGKNSTTWIVSDIAAAALNVYGQQVPGSLANENGLSRSKGGFGADMASPQGSHNINKGKRKAEDFYHHKRTTSPTSASTIDRFYCPRHGGKLSNHDERNCFSIAKHASSSSSSSGRAGSMTPSGSRPFTFLGNNNAPLRANGNNPCRFCKKPWFRGHSCQEYRQAMRANHPGPSVLAIRTDTLVSEEDEDKKVKEAMEDLSYDCKFDDDKSHNTRSTFNLMTPIYIEGRRLVAKVDSGSDVACINKKILNKDFSDIHINKVNGYLNFLALNNEGKNSKAKRIGKTRPMTVTYTNNISFKHAFEVVEFSDVMETEFDVLLGTDILPKMNIYLGGVAFNWPNDIAKESKQFENVNFDNDKHYDPDNALYGNTEQRKEYMKMIQASINKNATIKPKAVCTIPESIVKIPMKSGANCYVRQYPLPVHAKAEIEKQLKEWLDNGIVEKSKPSARFHSPLLAVPKKDENDKLTKLRICCDLRKINASISEDLQENFAVPKITEIFDRVSKKAKIMSKIDLKQAYYSFAVDEASREVLSFSYNHINYKWCHAPFGLSFLTSQYCRVMNILLGDLEGVETYVDDCVLYSETIEEHIKLINTVLERLTSVNLKINPDKCTWFRTALYLLGFIVGPGITKIDHRRLSNIDKWPIPKNAAQVRSIMGVISHLRDYCPMLSKVAAPLDQLRNDKDVQTKWTSLHTDRFNRIKQILVSNAVLHQPDLSKKFYLETDASVYGIACALTQRDEFNRTVHIAFISKSLNSAERNWSTNRRETAAIVFGLIRFRPLLWGHPLPVEVLTDHMALTYMFTSTTLNSTLQSYMDVIGQFNLNVVHLKGIANKLPDALSRVYPPIIEDQTLEGEQDRNIKRLEKCILLRRASSNNDKDRFIHKKKIYSKDKRLNILAVKLNSKDFKSKGTEYACPPAHERDQIIHDAHALGHFGIESVVKHIHTYQGLHWNTIYADCKDILSRCKECALHNVSKKGFNPQKSIVAFEPFSHVTMDLFGPLPVTEAGNIYGLVLVDICTKYIITRPIPNKQSDTVAKALINIFADYGLPDIIGSDNGREFRNGLMHTLTNTLGIQHRFSTPYYPQSNGAAERSVQMVKNTLRKLCGNDTSNWDERLGLVQLCCNIKVRDRTASTPFSLMFARQVDLSTNHDPKMKGKKNPVSVKELVKRADYMADVVFPAVEERTRKIVEKYNEDFNKKHRIIDIPIDTPVMVKLQGGRPTSLSPLYDGPYTVVRKTRAGTYVLKDESNELLHREYVPSELKVVSIDESAIEEELFEVEEIRDHKDENGQRLYLVKWVGYGERENDWISVDAFSSPATIEKYWEKVRHSKRLAKERLKDTYQKKTHTKSPTKNTITDQKSDNVSNNKRMRTGEVTDLNHPISQTRRSKRSRK